MGPKPNTGSILLVKTRIALATIGVSVAALFLLAFIWVQDSNTRLESARQTSIEHAQMAAERSAQAFAAIETTLGVFTSHIEYVLATTGELAARSDMFKSMFVGALEDLPHLAAITIIDSKGNIILTVGGNRAETRPAALAEYLRLHRTTGTASFHLVETSPDQSSTASLITITRRIDDSAGNFSGVVVARVAAELIMDFYDVTTGSGRFGAALLTEQSRVLSSSEKFLGSAGNLLGRQIGLRPSPPGRDALPSVEVGESQVASGYIAAAVPIADWPLTALVAYDPATVLRSSMGIRFGLTAAAVIVIFAGIMAFLILSRNYGKQHNAILQLKENRQELAHQVSELEDSKKRLEKQGNQLKHMADELILAKQSAEQGNRAKSNFLAQMSHELRTPLNAILGFSEIIRDQVFGADCPERYAGYADDIHSSGHHLLDIINDILDLSKIEAGKMELNEQPVDVGEVIEEVRRILAPRADDSGLELISDLPDTLPEVKADRRSVKQMLINLVGNAIKYTPSGGRVTVSVAIIDSTCRISVADTGIGISQEDLPNVLSPFGQVSAVDRSRGGTGLGVPIVSAMARLHGGDLQIESEPDVGSTFTVTLPKERIISLVSAA